MQNKFSVRFGIDHAGKVSGSAILDAIAPHLGVIVIQGVSDSQFEQLQVAAGIVRGVMQMSGNQTAADNFVCEKRAS